MAYEKLKDEVYKNLGGINVKASEYMTGENQVLDLRNYTFDRPGAWKSRPGYTGFATLNAGGSYAPNSVFEAVFSGFSNSLYSNPDLDLMLYASGTTLYNRTSLSAIANNLGPGSSGVGPVDFQIFNNILYFANGYAFQKFDTNKTYKYSIPSGNDFSYGATAPGATFASLFTPGGTLSPGFYAFQFAPARQLNGPSLFEIGLVNNSIGSSYLCVTVAAASQGTFDIFVGKTLPFSTSLFTSYGVSYAALYINAPGTGGAYNLDQIVALDQFILSSVNGTTQYHHSFDSPKPNGNILTFPRTSQEPDTDQYFTLAPQFIETYNNMMFMAGFSAQPSIVYHTELGNADKVEPEYFFEVRTSGNGDDITCLKPFQNSLIIFKKESTHELTGDSPETLSLQDTNLEYGCLNNQAAVTFENKLWFMDQKGIAEYNGANTYVISSPVESYLNECDKSTARAYHLKKYFQVWYLVQVSSSSNWRAFAYDYLINAWTIYDNFNITGGSNLFENSDNTKDLVFYGQNASLQSKFMRFGDLNTDDSFGITHLIKTKYHKRLGDSTQEMWRRFFLNNSVSGSSLGVTMNFRPDYGSSIYLSRETNLNQFQTRIDFGISAKSLSVELIFNASESITVNGYTIESRYLRSV